MKSLVAADEETRAEALTLIAAGGHLDTRDVAALRRRVRQEKMTRMQSKERERKVAITASVRKRTKEVLDSLDNEVAAFIAKVDAFVLAYKSSVRRSNSNILANVEYLRQFEAIKVEANEILSKFEEFLGSRHSEDHRLISRAHAH
jgi:hypothetical protein